MLSVILILDFKLRGIDICTDARRLFPATPILQGHDEKHFSPFYVQLNPICHLLALLGTHHIIHVSRIRV